MLADLPAAQVRALFPDATAFVDRHGVGPTRLSELRRLLADVRRAGHAGEDGEVTPGFASVAAPVHDHAGRPAASVAVTFVAEEVDPAVRERIAHRVARAAGELTRRINGRAPSSRGPSRAG
jgi:DNA-binding IclR family transcriptional regulator